jgi:drug/metabolite transporter (DMT)-like permease
MVVFSASIWPLMDAIARHLGEIGVPATQIAWGRYVGSAALLLPFVLARSGRSALLPRWEPLHLVRAVIPAFIGVVFFVGLRFLPFASASALYFTNPLFITVFSAMFLSERVRAARWAAVAAGFAGALLVIRPGAELFRAGALLPLVSAIGFAAVAVMSRRLAGHTPASATTFHYSLIGAIALAPTAALGWRSFDPALVLWLLAMAVIGGSATWLFTVAYERAEASVLAPFHYVELAAAVVVGFAVFGETPDLPALAGIALILGAGLAVSWRPRRVLAESSSLE